MTLDAFATPRRSMPLDDGWYFVPDPEAAFHPGTLPDGVPIRVPGAWEEHLDHPGGLVTAWYRRALEIPPGWDADDVVLRFGAVMASCRVYVDGGLLGEHRGGYLPFEVPLRGALRSGRGHELAIRVRNPFGVFRVQPAYSEPGAVDRAIGALGAELAGEPGGKQTWYTATSGLVRPVTLHRRPRLGLGRLRVHPNLAARSVTISWTVSGDGSGAGDPLTGVAVEVRDPSGAVAATWDAPGAAGTLHGEAVVAIPEPVPWEIGAPALYCATVRLVTAEGRLVDEMTTRFGMRDIGTADGRVTLNGRPVYLLGALDQDFYPEGRSTPPSREFLDAQVRRAQELGLNLLRCHVTIPDQAYLEVADEAGMLVWCELPNWIRFSDTTAEMGLATLADMVAELGNHPSIVIWTIVNEDWGTDVRREREHRAWLRRAYEHLRALDPTRLVVDNSACGRPGEENFHIQSDLADFHVYHLVPDNAGAWRERIADFASGPSWLWSPAGDAVRKGHEPLILSEFGSWGLLDLRAFRGPDGREPWWFATGPLAGRPRDMEERARVWGLDDQFGGMDRLVRATQDHQWEALRYEIAEMRRHPSIAGYVITELSDTYWEANGLLDMRRGRKAFHGRMAEANAPTVVTGELWPRDVVEGDPIRVPVTVSAWEDAGSSGGTVEWWIEGEDSSRMGSSGRLRFDGWPQWTAMVVGEIETTLPSVGRPQRVELRLQLTDGDGRARAVAGIPFSILPRSLAAADAWEVARNAGVILTDNLDAALMERARRGSRVVLVGADSSAVASDVLRSDGIEVHSRHAEHPWHRGAGAVWEGDWISTFAWIRSAHLRPLTHGRCLDLAFGRVLPDHVLPVRGPEGVEAGLFAGWVHAPAALTLTRRVGTGRLTVTTLRLDPDNGPIARTLLGELVSENA